MHFSITTRTLDTPGLSSLAASMGTAVMAAHDMEPFQDMAHVARWMVQAFDSPWLQATHIPETSTVHVHYKQRPMLTCQQVNP